MVNVAIANFPPPFFAPAHSHSNWETGITEYTKKSGVGVKMSTVEWPNATHSKSQLWKYSSIHFNGYLWHRYNWFCMKSDLHIWWNIDDIFYLATHFCSLVATSSEIISNPIWGWPLYVLSFVCHNTFKISKRKDANGNGTALCY